MTVTSTSLRRKLSENVRNVRTRIEVAAKDSGRRAEDIVMVAVTKTVGVDVIRMLLEMGITTLGESRVQEFVRRAAIIDEGVTRRALDSEGTPIKRPSWHLVGHLQRNKVRAVLPSVDLIQSLDSLRLAEEIDQQAAKLNRRTSVLVEVNAADESGKFGVAVGALPHLIEQIRSLPHIEVRGLMCMGPLGADRPRLEAVFSRTRELYDDLRKEGIGGPAFDILSMGMSDDFETAIACGSTMVRMGRALFTGFPSEAGHDKDPEDSSSFAD